MHTQSIEYIDDIRSQPIGCNAPLSEAALASGGLVKVSAYLRTRSSANALRVQKSRQRAASDGLRQLNVVVPVEAHAAIKAFAKGLQGGSSIADAAKALLSGELAAGAPGATVYGEDAQQAAALERLAVRLARMRGWRRWIARWMGLI